MAEPIKIGELLIRQLIELAVRARREGLSDEIVDIKRRQCHVSAFAGHPIGKVRRELQARMRSNQVRVVDVGIIQIAVGLHLSLHGLDDFALTQQLMVHFDAGNFLKRLRQRLRLISVGRDRFRQDIDFHTRERRCRIDEPLHFSNLVVTAKCRWLEFRIDPLFGLSHAGMAMVAESHHGGGCRGHHEGLFHSRPPVLDLC